MKWHPHIHLIVTGGGLSLDGKRWIETDPKFLMHHAGLKKRWKYQISTRIKKAHRESQWRFPKSKDFLREYPLFAAMINKLMYNPLKRIRCQCTFCGHVWRILSEA